MIIIIQPNADYLCVLSCDVLGVLEKEKCQSSSSLGLHGLSRGRRKAKASLRGQGPLPGKKSHHWSQGTEFPRRGKAQTYRRGLGNHSPHGNCVIQIQWAEKKLTILILQIFLVLIFILAVIIYRTLVQIPLFQNETFRPVAPMVASMSGAMVNLVFIMMLGRVYEKLALKLTTWGKNQDYAVFSDLICSKGLILLCSLPEMHRTQSEFDDNLTFKVFLFQFINFYASIFYIAFFKGRFVGYPGRYMHIFGTLRNEDVSG